MTLSSYSSRNIKAKMPSKDKVSGSAVNNGPKKSWVSFWIWDPKVKNDSRQARVEFVVAGISLAAGCWFACVATLGTAAVQYDSAIEVQRVVEKPSSLVSHSDPPFSIELSRAGE